MLNILQGHNKSVSSVDWSPDGRRVVSGSRDSLVKIWDVLSIQSEEGSNAAEYSRDDERIVSCGDDNKIRTWVAATGECLLVIFDDPSPNDANVSSSTLNTESGDKSKKKKKNRNLAPALTIIPGHSDWIPSVCFHPNRKFILSATADKSFTIKLWDAETGIKLNYFEVHTGNIYSVAYNHDGTYFASGSADNHVKIWESKRGICIKTMKTHKNPINCISFSPDGTRIASVSVDKTIKIFDVSTGNEVCSLHGHTDVVRSCSFSPDGKYLLSGSGDKSVKLWDAYAGLDVADTRHISGTI